MSADEQNQGTSLATPETPLGGLPEGALVKMIDERWFLASAGDVNIELNSHVSKLGLLLEACGYDDKVGVADRDCKTFTMRQYYQDGSPSLDYTDEEVAGLLKGYEKHIDVATRQKIERVLRPGLKKFESKYKNYERESAIKLGLG